MKRAFTLLELLIVIAVLVILMGLVFRLTSAGSESAARSVTVARLQRLENCLSGYYAAFGNYPPVKQHGLQNIFLRVNDHGIQTDQINKNIWGNPGEAWRQVRAACRAQPVGCRFPYPTDLAERVDLVAEEMKRRATSDDAEYQRYRTNETTRAILTAGFDDPSRNPGRFSSQKDKRSWRNIQLFQFGLMSFLLPRYMVMMNGPSTFFTDYKQWNGNNQLPSDPLTGDAYTTWNRVRDDATSDQQSDLARVANIPTQAVCARWMPNLANICRTNHGVTLFGIDIVDHSNNGDLDPDRVSESGAIEFDIFTPGAATSESTAKQYVLDGITVADGWGRDFYYYSPAPYQRYTLWSAGPNGYTFPPWIDRNSKDLGSQANERISAWVADDIMHLSN